MAIINFVISVYLCQLYGAVGCAVGTAISLVIANGILINVYYHKRCNIDILFFWKNIIQMSRGLIIPVIVGIALMTFVKIESIWTLLAVIVGYIAIYCISVYLCSMNSTEKSLVNAPFIKFFNRIRD